MDTVYFSILEAEGTEPREALCPGSASHIHVISDEKTDKPIDLSVFSSSILLASSLCEDWAAKRFFWPWQEAKVYLALCMAKRLLEQGHEAAVYLASPAMAENVTTYQAEETLPNSLRLALAADMPECPPALTDGLAAWQNRQLYSVAFGCGQTVRQFLAWAIGRFDFNYQNSYSSIADTLHTGQPGDPQAEFYGQWFGFAPAFDVQALLSATDTPQEAKTSGAQTLAEPETFCDGIPIHPLLKPYFARNYRLRLACKGNPYDKRPLFTDHTVVIGEEHGIPLTAMADCIWQNRPDLQSAFPKHIGGDRRAYMQWFAANAAKEYSLPEEYVANTTAALLELDAAEKRLDAPAPGLLSRLKRQQTVTKEQPQAAPPRQPGVNLCAHIRGEYGIGEASRMVALSLDNTSAPFTIVDIASERNYRYTNIDWLPQITNTFPYSVNLMYTNADGVLPFLQGISPDALRGRYNIGFWAWEMPEFPDEWQSAFAPLDEVWSLSQFSADAIATKSPVPVYSMPHPVVLDAPDPRYGREYFHLPRGRFLFLAMYDVRSVPERKNPMGAIRAFIQAFGSGTDAALVLKVNAPAGWQPDAALAGLLAKHPNILLMNRFLTRAELNGLLNSTDAYVSLHRSEGFGFGPAEAMLYGKPSVLTDWSGSQEYTRPGACCPVRYTLEKLEKDYGPYRKGWHWAQPDLEDAAVYMKRLATDREYYCSIAEAGQNHIRKNFSVDSAASRIQARLKEIFASHH